MKRALLVIDVQGEYFNGKLPATYPENSFQNILHVMDIAHANQLPILLIQHTSKSKEALTFVKGSKEWELHEEIVKKPHTCVIEKNLPSCFTHTNLEDKLKEDGIDTLVICGYMTQMCCDTTARHAFHKGYSVEFLSDATGTLNISNSAGRVSAEELHRAILVTQAMRFSQVLTSAEWEKVFK